MGQVTSLVEGYIELAAIPVRDQATQMPLPAAWRRTYKALDLVPIVSKEVEIDASCQYDNIATLMSFGDSMSFVGGINKPKLVRSLLQQVMPTGNTEEICCVLLTALLSQSHAAPLAAAELSEPFRISKRRFSLSLRSRFNQVRGCPSQDAQ